MLEKENMELKSALAKLQQSIADIQQNQKQVTGSSNTTSGVQLSIAPNPAKEMATITISANDNLQKFIVKISDATGKLIRTYNAETVSATYELNTSVLSKGTYMVQLVSKDEVVQTQKLVVQ